MADSRGRTIYMIRLEYQVVAEIRKEQKQPLFTPLTHIRKLLKGLNQGIDIIF